MNPLASQGCLIDKDWRIFQWRHTWTQENLFDDPPERVFSKMKREFLAANPDRRVSILAHPDFKGM